jgi:hypothetical protein
MTMAMMAEPVTEMVIVMVMIPIQSGILTARMPNEAIRLGDAGIEQDQGRAERYS